MLGSREASGGRANAVGDGGKVMAVGVGGNVIAVGVGGRVIAVGVGSTTVVLTGSENVHASTRKSAAETTAIVGIPGIELIWRMIL